MRKKYPYLEEPYVYNLNEEQEKRGILSLIDDFVNQRQYVNMTLLDWQENPLKEIQGLIASGSISKDGSSSVRRTCSLSCSVSKEEYNIDSMQMDFSLNKKIFIEIGIKNETDYYPEYPIFWFPQGVFYINSFSMNSSTSSAVNLTINLKDKMCLLNGDVGGVLPATVQFDIMTTQLADGTITEQKVLYYNIITELVHHWGEEDLNNIIIQDVPLRIRRVVQWNGNDDIYLSVADIAEGGNVQIYTEQNSGATLNKYSKGDRVGYVYDDFVPVSEVTGAAGDTVCTILDTIKNQLGNYEYFYDVFGIFHFREIKNYLNINQSTIILQESSNPGRYINLEEGQFLLDSGSEKQYLIETTNDKNVYTFDSNRNLTSISITPNYNNIKNDFIVDGIRQSDYSDNQFLIRYRLVIDEKPEIVEQIKIGEDNGSGIIKGSYGSFNNVLYYTYPEYYEGKIVSEVNKLGFWYDNWVTIEKTDNDGNVITEEQLQYPTIGNMDQIYRVIENGENVFYLWTGAGYHKLYLIDDTIDASEHTDWLFVENTISENISNSETEDTSHIIADLEGMASFIQGKKWWNTGEDDWPYFSVTINDTIYKDYNSATTSKENKYKTLEKMREDFFAKYINTLPYSNIVDFINYEKLDDNDKINIDPPLYSDINSIVSLLLDKIESLKTKEEIAECLKQYLNKSYINENSSLGEIKYGLPQDISDIDFFRRYPNTLNLTDLEDFYKDKDNPNITVFENQEAVDDYIQTVIDDLLTITDPLIVYQEILSVITEWENKDILENKNIYSLLNYLVGDKDQLNPLKYNNYEDLHKIYVKSDNAENSSNIYNRLKDILTEYNEDLNSKIEEYESAYLFETPIPIEEYKIKYAAELEEFSEEEQNSKYAEYVSNHNWRNREGVDFLGTLNSEKGAYPIINKFITKKVTWEKEINSNKSSWPENISILINNNEETYMKNINNWHESLDNISLDIDTINNLVTEIKEDNGASFYEFENWAHIIKTNMEAIEKFYGLYSELKRSIESAVNNYKLKNKLAKANQSTDGTIKFKPIVYSSTIGYPDQKTILKEYYTLDWRTYLYLYGQYANVMGTDPGPYFSDLEAFWPYEYNLNRDKQCFIDELDNNLEVQYKQLTNGNFFFDMIDASSSSLGEFSVKNIGRRLDVVNDENINCLFEPEIPDVVFLNMDNPDANWSENTTVTELRSAKDITNKLEEQRLECINNNQPFIQVSDEIYNNLTTGKYLSDAYEQIKYELFAHLKYQKVVSITALPAYYLEPNNRVTLKDYSTNIYGDYMIQNINLTLGPGANMAVTLNEVSERL